MALNRPCAAAMAALLLVSGFLGWSESHAELRDIRTNAIGLAFGREEKTPSPDFEGNKVILDARYSFRHIPGDVSEKKQCCTLPSVPSYYLGTVDFGARWGTGGRLEYTRVGVTPFTVVYTPDKPSDKRLRATHDLLELGMVRYISDEALEVDSYVEITAARAGRAGTFRWSPDSRFSINGLAQASGGWSWAESEDQAYRRVSNPFVGFTFDLELRHAVFGALYTSGRFVNGFSFSSPARGHPTVREARARIGYLLELGSCLEADLFLEKRSFYFDEADLPGLYTRSGTFAGQLTCQFQ